MALSFFINRKRTTCVITFKGSLAPNDADVLEACTSEALKELARYYILNMSGMRDAEAGASRPFALFQQALRAKSKLYLSDLQGDASRILKAEGVIRDTEVLPDLMSALQAILNEEKG